MPNFLVVGTPKAGTTALYYSLLQHPDIFVSNIKEPNHFLTQSSEIDRNSIKGIDWIENHDDYLALFQNGYGAKAIGEASVSYLYNHKIAIPEIKKCLGDPKIIIMLRNPVERAFSAYTHWVLEGWENRSFEEAIRDEIIKYETTFCFHDIFPYMKSGFYFEQVKSYLENFSNVRVFLFDDLNKDAVGLIQSVFAFLEVDKRYIPDVQKYNVSGFPRNRLLFKSVIGFKTLVQQLKLPKKAARLLMTEHQWQVLSAKISTALFSKLLKKSDIDPKTASYLQEEYREDIYKLEKLTGKDLSNWLLDTSLKRVTIRQ